MSTEIEIIEAMGLELAGAAMRAGEPTTAAAVLAATQYRMAEVDDDPGFEPTPDYYRSIRDGWLQALDLAVSAVNPAAAVVDQIADRMTVRWREPEPVPKFAALDTAGTRAYVDRVNELIAATETGVIPQRIWAGIEAPYPVDVEEPRPFTEVDDDPGCTLCGRDNRNGTHDALERTGHLRHAFTTTEPQS